MPKGNQVMKQFNGIEYLAIDIANHFGLDKLPFEDRIQWVKSNQDNLEQLEAEEPHLYAKAVNHFRKVLKGLPTGHTVALDSVCSGLQLMSVMTGDESGCYMTGLIDPDTRTDAYTIVTDYMNELLGNSFSISRADAKRSVMTSLYGSEAVPKEIFGDKTKEFYAFHKALNDKCKGAYTLLQVLKQAWDSTKYFNHWVLPDGFNAYIPVMESVTDRVNINELNYTMSIQTWINQPQERGISLCANMVHSVDAYVLRTLVRRCNYNPKQVKNALALINDEILSREEEENFIDYDYCDEAIMPIHLFNKTGLADIVCIQHIDKIITHLPDAMLEKLSVTLTQMIQHEPFELITVHDSFACHPNHCNQLRYWYKEILAEIAESTLLDHLLSQIMDDDITFKKMNPDLAPKIRESNYGLC